jgi:hypothetical protein
MGCWLALVKQMLPLLIELLGKARPEFVLQTVRPLALMARVMQETVRKEMEPAACHQLLQNRPARAKRLRD